MSRHRSAADIARCDGYAWNLRDKLGKGSYGDVYKGWNNKETLEVAVKVVRKDLFKQDPKAEQNLRREIDLLFKLKNCEYVVGLFHIEDMKRSNAIVMVMELCECDLDHLLKVKPFGDNEITLLLHQLAEGMKALKAKNIVHRDIKPGNILIKYHAVTGKMMLKIADFGFARHFTDEMMKPLDLTSLAGTPVFMAPEALRCVFNHGAEHYDEKVDLWSIGALLYKVIVGQCGFYAQLNHILHILNKKGDAIAWAPSTAPNYGPTPSVKYINELPPEVDDRLSPPYKQKMNQLLIALLKLDPNERMTFDEFFDFIDDLMKSKVEVINLLHGSSIKFMMEPGMKLDHLLGDIQAATGVPVDSQIIFSSQSDIYLSIYNKISSADFNIFMNRSGGSQGHAVLYFVPVNEIMAALIEPDYGVIAKLFFVVESKAQCVQLILEHKYAKEIVHSISMLQKQLERQFACIREFRSFCTKQFELLNEKIGDTRQTAQETLSRASLADEWLRGDIGILNKGSSLDTGKVTEYRERVKKVHSLKREIEDIITDLNIRLESCEMAITKAPSLEIEDILKNASQLFEMAKQLPRHNRDFIFTKCEELLALCKGVIVSGSERAHKMLSQLYTALSGVWSVIELVDTVKQKRDSLEDVLQNGVPKWRADLLAGIPPQVSMQSPYQQATPPHAWGKPQSSTNEIAELRQQLEERNMEIAKLRTNPPLPSGGHQSVMSSQETENLTQRLKAFCISARRIVDPNKPPPSPNSERKMYPDLVGGESDGYLFVSQSSADSLEALLPEATLQLQKLEPKLLKVNNKIGDNEVAIKITNYENYPIGDIVMFHPVGKPPTNFQLNLLHLTKPLPYVFLHKDCYPSFSFRFGRMADLVIARISKPLQQAIFKDDPAAGKAANKEGSSETFYYVWAEPMGIDFQRKALRQAPPPKNSKSDETKSDDSKRRSTPEIFNRSGRKYV